MKFLFWAYTITWVVIFGYIFSLGWRQKKLAADIEILKKMVNIKQGKE